MDINIIIQIIGLAFTLIGGLIGAFSIWNENKEKSKIDNIRIAYQMWTMGLQTQDKEYREEIMLNTLHFVTRCIEEGWFPDKDIVSWKDMVIKNKDWAITIISYPESYSKTLVAWGKQSLRDDNYDHGVMPWQAERAIKDYINKFINAQREFAQIKLPNDQFYIRVKIEKLMRDYNEATGWIWVAQFSGAILPSIYDRDKEQGYAYGILKIYIDKNNDVQVTMNEGEGLWRRYEKMSILYQSLPETPGGWKEWGGNPRDILQNEDISTTDPNSQDVSSVPVVDFVQLVE